MNQVFHEYLDKFVVMYHDDILVYNVMMKEHKEHLAKLFRNWERIWWDYTINLHVVHEEQSKIIF